jgi:signal peptidase I
MMRLLHTAAGGHYRRWVNVALSLVLPGAAQFLCGRKARGVLCYALTVALEAAWCAVLVHPATPWSVLDSEQGLSVFALFLPRIVVAVDAVRRPLPRLRWRGWSALPLVYAGVVVLPALAFRTLLYCPYKIPTGAMFPTLHGVEKDAEGEETPGDHVWVNRFIYRFHEPRRGDLVVFKTKGLPMVEQDTYFLKRVAGLPGETVGIEPPYVMVNGDRVLDPPVFREISARENGHCGYVTARVHPSKTFRLAQAADRITLEADEYLVLGDRSTNSFDGRYYGPVKRQAIIGRVESVYAPAARKRVLR